MPSHENTGDASSAPADRARSLLRRGVRMELWGYLSILRLVFRRPKVPSDATAFTYHQPVLPLLIVFIVISAIELVVVDLLVRRWTGVRIGLLILGVWGLVWMVGLLCGFLTRPHAVGPSGMLLRSGAELEVALDWEQIASVSQYKRITPDKQPQISTDADGHRTLHLHMQNETNVKIVLRGQVSVSLPGRTETVSQILLFADRPPDFVAATAQHRVKAS